VSPVPHIDAEIQYFRRENTLENTAPFPVSTSVPVAQGRERRIAFSTRYLFAKLLRNNLNNPDNLRVLLYPQLHVSHPGLPWATPRSNDDGTAICPSRFKLFIRDGEFALYK